MRIEQYRWSLNAGWEPEAPPGLLADSAQLVLLFVSPGSAPNPAWFDQVRRAYPGAHLFG